MISVPLDDVRALLTRLFVSKCLFKYDAEIAAQRLIEADLRGLSSYGAAAALKIIEAIACGDLDPRGRVLKTHETPALVVLDGSRAVGPVAATRGMESAIAKAVEVGVGTAVVGNSQTLGAASVYALLAARQGLIGFVTSSTGGATVTPPGGGPPVVGNHPLAWAVPVAGRSPFVLDFACGATSWSRIGEAQANAAPLPELTALDESGAPTRDPESACSLLPRGGPAGFGLSFLCSVLTGGLAGGRLPIRKRRSVSSEDSQHFFQAIDPGAFIEPERFTRELTMSMNEIRQTAAIEGGAFRFPGDDDELRAERIRTAGIPFDPTVYEQLGRLAPGGWMPGKMAP